MHQNCIRAAVAVVILGAFIAAPARADIILDFSDLNNQSPVPVPYPGPYVSQGFSLSSTGGFNINGPNTGFYYAGEIGLAPIEGSTVTLMRTSGGTFNLLAIDLARNFSFDPAPTVTFTGTLASGGTVTESFLVTNPGGATTTFQMFTFTGFREVTQVTWNQPTDPALGLHQFTDVDLTVPEPSTLLLAALGACGGLIHAWRRLGG
jgi:hypothetical protein